MKSVRSPEAYLLRAEELRVIAGQSRLPEVRNFLLAIAKDYEGLAGSTSFVTECRERLSAASHRLETPMVEAGPIRRALASDEDTSGMYRSLAADAREMATRLGSGSQDAWLQLADRWSSLADRIEYANQSEDS